MGSRNGHPESTEGLSATQQRLDALVGQALASQSPPGLSQRVGRASAPFLAAAPEPVILRLDRRVAVRRLALAACVGLAALVAVRVAVTPVPLPTLSVAGVLSVEAESQLLEDLDLGQYAYLAETRDLAFVDLAVDLDAIRADLELWQYGLLTE